MSIFQFFKPAPAAEEIQDATLIQKKYRYWRIRIFLGMYIGYALYYLTRKSVQFAMPAMAADLGLGKLELGLFGTILSLAYGTSKFLSGMIGDRSNPRYFMAIGLIFTGVINLLFGLSSMFWALAVLWGLNGWFQGWGAPGCAKLLTYWYSQSERGRWWSLWSTSQNVGGSLIPYLAAYCAQSFGWRSAMCVPGCIAIISGFYVMYMLRDTPQSLGLPSIERFRNDEAVKKTSEPSTLSNREIFFTYVLKNRWIWLLGVSYFFVYVIRTACSDWSLLYLVEVRGYPYLTASFCVSAFEIGGFLGSLAAGWSSDLVFRGRRAPVNVLFMLSVATALIAFRSAIATSPAVDFVFLFCFGFFVFGPQMLIGIAAAELSHKRAAGTAVGFVGCFAYLGAATAGAPLGAICDRWGWNSFFLALIACALIGSLLLLPLWSAKTSPAEETPST